MPDYRTTFSVEVEVHGIAYHDENETIKIREEIHNQIESAMLDAGFEIDGIVKINFDVNSDNMSQSALELTLPLGTEFDVLIDYDGEIIQNPFYNSYADPSDWDLLVRYNPDRITTYEGTLESLTNPKIDGYVETIPPDVKTIEEYYDYLENL